MPRHYCHFSASACALLDRTKESITDQSAECKRNRGNGDLNHRRDGFVIIFTMRFVMRRLLAFTLPLLAGAARAPETIDLSHLPWPPPTSEAIPCEVQSGWWKPDFEVTRSTTNTILSVQPHFVGRAVPFAPPYRLRLSTSGGSYLLALPDYRAGAWRVHAGPVHSNLGEAAEFCIGLSPNAVDETGRFCLALAGPDSMPEVLSLEVEYPAPPQPGQPLEVRQYIPARDGTLLATTVYLPYEPATALLPGPPYPAILMRTPYRAEYIDPAYIALATQLSCAVVTQCFRGRPSPDPQYDAPQSPFVPDSGAERWPISGGKASLYRDHAGPDHFDALDTVNWLEARPWYNGRLLLTGPSGLGLWIYQAAPALGNRVSAIYPQVAAGDIGDWAALENGCVRRQNISAWLDTFNYPADLRAQALAECDRESCWEPLRSNVHAAAVRCPGFHETCWWDIGVEAGIASWQALNSFGAAGARGRQWLLIGPWEHGRVRTNRCGALALPTEPAECDATRPPLRWEGALWAAQLLGRNPLYRAPEARVMAYFIGEQGRTDALHNHWVELPTWPPPAVGRVYHLRDSGLLADTPETMERVMRFDFTASNPVPSIGGANIPVGGTLCGPLDQAPAEAHPGVLVFRSAPLAADLAIAGDIRIDLSISTEAADADLVVKLTDLYPAGAGGGLAGASLLVSEGAARLGCVCARPYRAGETARLSFSLGQRAYVFGAGHRIGISVQAGSFPRFELNPTQIEAARTRGGSVENALHLGGTEACTLTLPVFK